MPEFFTIGHSNRSVEAFIAILRDAGIDTVVDVRSMPRSRSNPQFNADTLPAALAACGIDYVHLRELGGLRGRQRTGQASPNGFWENASFRSYADYAMSEPFRSGLQTLRSLGETRRCAVMCAEAVWWRCHRRIIADYLIAAGETVLHILGTGRIEPARMNAAAQGGPAGSLIYQSE